MILNERVYHDLATVKAPSDVAEKVSKPVWQLLVDEATGLKFSTFHKTKDAILDDSSARLKAMERLAGKEIKILRQDNAGENKSLETDMKSSHWSMETKFEYTASGTPQQNSYAEVGFTALAGMPRAMRNKGNVPRANCYKLFCEAVKTALKLDGLVIVDINVVKKTQVEHYANIIPRWVKHMRTFGEAGTVRTGKDGKVNNRGVTMMMVGYADKHEGNCYQMFNPLRNSIVESRDVTWLRRMYYP